MKSLSTLFKIGGVLGGIAGSALSNYSVRVPNLSTRPEMAGYKRRPGRAVRTRYKRRTFTALKKGMSTGYRSFVRTTGLSNIPISASNFSSTVQNVTLSMVNTGDLTSLYRLYRIKKVVVRLSPRVDPANSGLVNNFSTYVHAACDPEGTSAPGSMQIISSYDNSFGKWINAGEDFNYTFYPKVVNTVDVSGVATAAGSYQTNPWLQLNATGITVPHRQLVLAVQIGSSSTITYDFNYDIYFEVRE